MNQPVRAIAPTSLISPDDIRVLNTSTKIAIRMFAGVERVVPPDFVGLALAAGALPGVMYVATYGQYKNVNGELVGEPILVEEEADPAVVVMKPKEVVVPDMIVKKEVTQADILGAMAKIQEQVAARPDTKSRVMSADGRPKVPAIEAILGVDITAAQRDAAWDSMVETAE